MYQEVLTELGLTKNEIKIYVELLKSGSLSAYELGRRCDIYRVHVYDKLEQLSNKGLVTYVYEGAKKYFQATNPNKIKQIIEDRKAQLKKQENELNKAIPTLLELTATSSDNMFVEVFKGKEGLKYFLKDIIKEKQEVLISGINDEKYQEAIPIFMQQYFRDIKNNKIPERVITMKNKGVFLFDKKLTPTTEYRFLDEKQFNPTNTFVYANKVVIVTWESPITAIMIKNENIAQTYKSHFEQLWKIASKINS